MDDDSTTIARAQEQFLTDLEKQSDRNHTLNGFTSKLYELKKKHPAVLSVKVIKYIKRLFVYGVLQNQGNKEGLKHALQAIVGHVYGQHQQCNSSWCEAKSNPKGYHFKSLPHGKPLQCKKLKSYLMAVLKSKYTDKSLEKLKCLDSSNANESINSSIARKAPKSLDYSGSESLDYRVAAAVAQKK